MKKVLLALSICFLANLGLKASEVTVNLPENSGINEFKYNYISIDKFANATTRDDRRSATDSVAVNGCKAVINLPDISGGYMVNLRLKEGTMISVYVDSDENFNVNIKSLDPLNYSFSGTPLADGMNKLVQLEKTYNDKRDEIMAKSDEPDHEALGKLYEEYNGSLKNFIQENVDSPAAPVALLDLEGEDYVAVFENMPESAKTSLVYPLAKYLYDSNKKNLELEQKQKAMASGDVEAPGFTLKDLEGKEVSLSDFRGKWVILDFWGSWCIWCIRGIPELKEAYEKYAGKLEIIGIDCNESVEAWKAGVEKYELPWVNVYNPEGSPLTSEYGVQGYPTKAIVDPQGKIRNITTGHDPEFYVVLKELMGE